MLRLSSLSVTNFRSIRDQTFEFPELAVLVGKNDVGKSNVLRAIDLLIDGGSLEATDAYDPAEPIVLDGTFDGATEYSVLCDPKNRSKVTDRIDSKGRIRIRRMSEAENKLGKIEINDPRDNKFGMPTGIDAAIKPLLPEIIFIGALGDVS